VPANFAYLKADCKKYDKETGRNKKCSTTEKRQRETGVDRKQNCERTVEQKIMRNE
jgi:hypothetical protein